MASDLQRLSIKRIKSLNTIRAAARHNLREIKKELGANSHIDASRIANNLVLAGADDAAGVVAMHRETLQDAEIFKTRKNAVLLVEVVISLPATSTIAPECFFRDGLQWLRITTLVP